LINLREIIEGNDIMFLEDELIEMTWERRSKPIYTQKGYIFTKIGEPFLIKQKDLSSKSHRDVKVICDYCDTVYFMKMNDYTNRVKNHEYVNKCACEKCKFIKSEEVNMIKYGVKSTLQLEDVKNQIKKTNIIRYGVENPAQSQEVQNQMKSTMMERYGVEYSAQSPEIRQKQINTNIERYGVEYSLQNEEVKRKSKRTLFKNNTAPTSRTQKYLHELLGGKLNYPLGNYYIDIVLNDNIAFEYDGGGHRLQVKFGNLTDEEFDKKEIAREFYLKRRGYKIVRLVSTRDKLPEKDILLDAIYKCLEYVNDNGTNSEINIDEGYVRLGKNILTYNFGNLIRMDKDYFDRLYSQTS
jgi:very-short-patch-repair endonuclease